MSQDGDGLQADALDRPGPPPELRDPPRRSRALGAFFATFALAAFAGIVWYAYDRGLQAGSEATAPLIQADPQPIKVRPEQPGGLDVPNQDKLVYGALRPGQDGSEIIERLLPPPETPVEAPEPRPEATPAPPAEQDRGGPAPAPAGGSGSGTATVPIPPRTPQPVTVQPATPQPAPAQPAPAESATPQPSATQTPTTRPAPTEESPPPPAVSDVPPATAPLPIAPPPAAQPPVQQPPAPRSSAQQTPAPPPPPPVAQPRPEPTAQPAPAPQPAPQATGRFRVQLGAFRDEDAARREWDRLRGRYPDLLSDLTLRIQRVDLGAERGVFHRIQGGMLSEQGAENTCAVLKARNQPCLLVRP